MKLFKNSIYTTILFFCLLNLSSFSQPTLIGYWQNWDVQNAPYIQLDQVDQRYDYVMVSFAIPQVGNDYHMEFTPYLGTPSDFILQIQALQSAGKKVFISIGGASSSVLLSNISERDTFISTMNTIIDYYGFDGLDIDLEGSSLSVNGGTIQNPVDAPILHMTYAIQQIMLHHFTTTGNHLLLSMAPETAHVHGGMSTYSGIWGAYLPWIEALRDSIDVLHVQLYNSGSMYGIDGNIYFQSTADFIVAMTEAVIRGFNTPGGVFAGLPPEKVAVGLPACPNAAGGGYTDPDTVIAAVKYLRGTGPQPGSYGLLNAGGYPNLRGMMTWSINWDAVNTCASTYEYAQTFQDAFGLTSTINEIGSSEEIIFPNPCATFFRLNNSGNLKVYNSMGKLLMDKFISENSEIDMRSFSSGIYFLSFNEKKILLVKE